MTSITNAAPHQSDVTAPEAEPKDDDHFDHHGCCRDKWIGLCGYPLDIPTNPNEQLAFDDLMDRVDCVVCHELFDTNFCPHGGHCPEMPDC